ncbi:hypothetical protein N9K06_00170 [Omnitrophica bacterium]|nr:hypothetical protein [Candidatus Omnitrophota bacterium]
MIPQKTAQTFYPYLAEEDRLLLENLDKQYSLTYQEFRKIAEAARDLELWQDETFAALIGDMTVVSSLKTENHRHVSYPQDKDVFLKKFFDRFYEIRNAAKIYPSEDVLAGPKESHSLRIVRKDTEKKIYGDCPVASEETVCCNLKTIDAVENCAFGCSYCTIQTFYGPEAVLDAKLKQKLEAIEIHPGQFYHFGTGQSSDSLIWGNRHGLLDDLCGFAAKHPNVLLEFKTKSDHTAYFEQNRIPKNVVCSWSLNTEPVICHEEAGTASLQRRLEAARKVADHGVKVAFHFHPMVYYEGWQADYEDLGRAVQAQFDPKEVLFISFGSVTFIKPVMQQIRRRQQPTRILQMELVPAPKGKFSYPEDLKIRQFQTMYNVFKPWQGRVYMYLCMEPARIWDSVFGWHYPTNEEFESDFGLKTLEVPLGSTQT